MPTFHYEAAGADGTLARGLVEASSRSAAVEKILGLGQTPVRPHDPGAASPFLFRPGDRIRFRPITARELDALTGAPGEHFLDLAERT